MMWPFAKPKPIPPGVIIRDRLGREIDRVEGWNLEHKDLRLRDWRHVDLHGVSLAGSDLSGTNMLGADLRDASLRYCKLVGCEISYADVSGCDFSGSNLAGCLMWRTETYGAKLHDVLFSEESDIPRIKVLLLSARVSC
jgi:uncharacterized protein YjbI with pentapeptide repeats